MNPTVLLVRHAETELNDPKNEKIRGYSDIPISYKGKDGLRNTASFLKEQAFPIAFVLSSPLQRAMMSANEVAQPFGAKVIPNNSLLPWSLGKLTGEPVAMAAKEMNYYQEYPDIKVPEGESYRDFYNRWAVGLDKMLLYAEQHPEEVLVGVVHSRNLLALPSILGSRDIGDVPVKGGPPPESVTQISQDENGNWHMKVIHQEPA